MKFPSDALHTAYYDLLDGNITYNNNTIDVHDTVPDSPTYPYIQFSSMDNIEFSAKDTFSNDFTISLSVVDRFQSSKGSRKGIDSITNDITDTIVTKPPPFDLNDFNVYSVRLDNVTFLREQSDTYIYFRNEIRLRHLISQT